MNYKQIYDSLIFKARSENRVKRKRSDSNFIYYENHHIIPRCLGGTDRKDNLVLLTAKEHFIAHKLLVEIHPKNGSLVHALWMMSQRAIRGRTYLVSSREFENLKIKRYTFLSEEKSGVPKTIEHNEKNRLAHLGKKRSQETKDLIKKALIGRKQSVETCQKKREVKLGTKQTEEHKSKRVESRKKNYKTPIVICPNCGKQGKGPGMYRHHFNNCKK